MRLRKHEYLRRSIKADPGMISWTSGIFYLLFLILFFMAQMQLVIFQVSSMYMEDALAASNLASALIDPVEYGISGQILFTDPVTAFQIYQDAVVANLSLDGEWNCDNKHLIAGRVKVEQYTIYNVKEDIVEVISIAEDNTMNTWTEGIEAACAPDGQPITHTSIYSELSYPVKGILGIEIEARKGKLVDIVSDTQK